MEPVITTKMSVKGQVVIPEPVRKRAGFQAGDRFIVIGDGDTVVLRRLRAPSQDEFKPLVEKAREAERSLLSQWIDVDRDALARLCQERGIRRLAVFGSAMRGEATDASDLDVLVEFEEGRKPGLGFFALQRDLAQLFGRDVDLNTAEFLSPEFRQTVIDGAVTLYARA